MDNLQTTKHWRTVTAICIAAALLSGCGKTADWIRGKMSQPEEQVEILGAPEIDEYVNELGQIASGDPAAQAEIIADASAAATLTPSATTKLRYGLVLAIPGHPESNPTEAQKLLREVLAEKLLLTPAEVALATIHLNSVERQIVAETETRNLRLSTSRAAESQEQATYQRLSTVEAENRRLRRDLAEAEQKLEAITSIERSISDQE